MSPEPSPHTERAAPPSEGLASSRVRADIAARTHAGNVRESNEDSFVVLRIGRFLECVSSSLPEMDLPHRNEDVGHVMIVADGVGGHEGGEVASRTAMLTTMRFILDMPKWSLRFDDPATRDAEVEEVHVQGRRFLDTVHDELRRLAASDVALAGMGTTLTGAYSVGVDLFVFHVGDSKAYRLRNGAMQKITHDHTVAQDYADMGLIQQDEVASHRMQHVLTRAVGGPSERLDGDIHHERIEDGDRLLLCSDGLTDMVTEDEIAGLLATHASSQEACEALVAMALERGGRDNVTVIVAGYRVK